ncbi:hypothetical protein CWE13_05620 [Aliidiomarina shirensis]|uniref:Cytoskeleton protein RodZ-like C-terminal domain-containing protein n=1 Tax=Aliidiomarina shirensis TaxID=1048642 RepID=A0A432WUK9_9GAMM|nr:RodZ domain-containing protein [Aliidiomarina shirensis]RUO37437.1 hypothetical protein CWE13_05620 [Aliidiomarina shirensis]
MTNKNESDEDLQPEVVEELVSQRPTPGELLRLGRENMGLSVGQVADRLRLRQQQIQELEDDVFTAHVSGTYIRGYLRSYAKLVQVNETEIIAAYEHLIGDQAPKGQMQSFSRKTSIETQDNRLMLVTWIIVLILIGSVAVFVWQKFVDDRDQASSSNIESSFEVTDSATGNDTADIEGLQPDNDQLGAVDSGENESTLEQLEPTTVDTAAETAASAPGPESESEGSGTPVAPILDTRTLVANNVDDSANTTAEAADNDPAGDTPSINTIQEQSENTDPASQGELVLVFSGDSWIRIEDDTGEAIAYGVKQSGYTMPLDGTAPYDLTLGAPSVVAVYFRGERVDLSEFSGGRIARFTLPRS